MKRHRRQETTRGEKLEEAPAALKPGGGGDRKARGRRIEESRIGRGREGGGRNLSDLKEEMEEDGREKRDAKARKGEIERRKPR